MTASRKLASTLHDDLTSAMRASDELRTSTLRLALAAIQAEEVAGKAKRELSDGEVLAVLAREVRKRTEAAAAYADAGRADRAERERAEAEVLQAYLPAQLSDAELAELVQAAVTESGASGPQGMGTAMKAARAAVGNRAEGARVAALVKQLLA